MRPSWPACTGPAWSWLVWSPLMLRSRRSVAAGRWDSLGATVWSVANLWTLERLSAARSAPGAQSTFALALGILVKLPMLYALLVLFISEGRLPRGRRDGRCVACPLLVIVLKVAGRMLALRLRASGPGLPEPRS